mgnify:CR=1 FL=1
MKIIHAGILSVSAIVLTVVGCSGAKANEDLTVVKVEIVNSTEIPIISELPGRVAATRISEVRARVSGILQERIFQQGSKVKQGDVLYKIDPKLFEVRVASARAVLQRAQAVQVNTKQIASRHEKLRERNIISGGELENSEAALKQAEAEVALAQASLQEAEINLGYTEVRAPITGVIGGALLTEGGLVTADSSQSLALIQQIDPVYVDFTQSSSEFLSLKRAKEKGELKTASSLEPRVELIMEDGSVYPQPGKMLFSSTSVDETTGKITLRAEFPNPKGELLPGQYARVRFEQSVSNEGIVIPQRSVVRTSNGEPQVFVVNDNVASPVSVVLGKVIDGKWVVESGLTDGDQIVVDGVQKVVPGKKLETERSDTKTEVRANVTRNSTGG